MYFPIKLEGSDIMEMMPLPTEEERRAASEKKASSLKGVQDEIISHASTLSISYEAEDEIRPATMQELLKAVESARTEELETFLSAKGKSLPFEDGYISVRF